MLTTSYLGHKPNAPRMQNCVANIRDAPSVLRDACSLVVPLSTNGYHRPLLCKCEWLVE
jgi:hypothetical protein